MQPETPVIPHTWIHAVWILVASSLGYAGSLLREWINKKRSPAEEAKTHAEARQIDANTNLELMKAASDALTKACRLQDERDHWQRKSESLEKRVELQEIEISSMDQQMRRLHGFINSKGLHISEMDIPK